MGTEKHMMFHKVKHILSKHNDESREMASMLEDVISGKAIAGIDDKK